MRVKFKFDNDRDLFFDLVKENFSSWNEISVVLKINRNTLLNYRTGTNLMPLSVFNVLKGYGDLEYLESRISFYDDNWGRKLGGISNYKKNKWVYELGRKRTIELHKEKDKILLDLDLTSPKVAEFVGVLIGDGFIGKYERHRIIQITGNKITDRIYYKKFLIPLMEEIFSSNVYFYERDTCIRISVYSKIVFNTLRNLFGFPLGKKGEITIPDNMLSTDECKVAVIRGLFDTDGYVGLERKKYPVINICTTSKKLSIQIQDILNQFGFGAYVCRCQGKGNRKISYRITIFGKQKVLKWKDLIGSSNPSKMKRINASVA